MTTFLTRIATASFAVLWIGTAVTQVQAQQAVPAVIYSQRQIGVNYIVRPLSNGDNYLKITAVDPGSPASLAGLQVGDWISKVGGRRVRSQFSFNKAINSSADRVSFRVWDSNSRQWTWITVVLRSVGPPGNPGGNGQLMGIWQSSGGGTVHFFGGNPNHILAESNVPWVGPSDLVVTPNGDGSYNFTYQQRGGFRDSGFGKLTPRNGNTIDGHLVNQLGIRANFVLTR